MTDSCLMCEFDYCSSCSNKYRLGAPQQTNTGNPSANININLNTAPIATSFMLGATSTMYECP